jgi:hypothetical protein
VAQVALEALKGEQTVAELGRRSDPPNGYRSPGDVETRVLWVNTPPTF